MTKKPTTSKEAADKVVKNIRRKTRQTYSSEEELCFAIRDAFPVTEHHTLVIPKRHVADYFDLHQPERTAIEAILHEPPQSILN